MIWGPTPHGDMPSDDISAFRRSSSSDSDLPSETAFTVMSQPGRMPDRGRQPVAAADPDESHLMWARAQLERRIAWGSLSLAGGM
jgi:hypothetical protein